MQVKERDKKILDYIKNKEKNKKSLLGKGSMKASSNAKYGR